MRQRYDAPSRDALLASVRTISDTVPRYEIGTIDVLGVRMRGYVNAPRNLRFLIETAAAHGDRTAVVAGRTRWSFADLAGDLGVIDSDGQLTLVGRIKDMLLRGGENVACLEVEGALAAHQDILEAAVIGIPDERLGERVGAAIVLRDGAELSDEAIGEFLAPRLAMFKRPERYWRLPGPLPRSGAAKIDKLALRRLLLASPDNRDESLRS